MLVAMETRLVLGLPFHTLNKSHAAWLSGVDLGADAPGVAGNQAESRVPAVTEQNGSDGQSGTGEMQQRRCRTHTAQGKLKAVMMPMVPMGFQTCGANG